MGRRVDIPWVVGVNIPWEGWVNIPRVGGSVYYE